MKHTLFPLYFRTSTSTTLLPYSPPPITPPSEKNLLHRLVPYRHTLHEPNANVLLLLYPYAPLPYQERSLFGHQFCTRWSPNFLLMIYRRSCPNLSWNFAAQCWVSLSQALWDADDRFLKPQKITSPWLSSWCRDYRVVGHPNKCTSAVWSKLQYSGLYANFSFGGLEGKENNGAFTGELNGTEGTRILLSAVLSVRGLDKDPHHTVQYCTVRTVEYIKDESVKPLYFGKWVTWGSHHCVGCPKWSTFRYKVTGFSS